MAFEPKISFVSWDKTGSIMTLRDDSPYGTPNPNVGTISKLRVTLSLLTEEEVLSQSYTETADILSIAAHNPFTVDSPSLGQSLINQFLPFEDGVYNLDYYVFIGSQISATGVQGDAFITLNFGNTVDYSIYDSIEVGTDLYDIDKAHTTLSNLALVQPLLTSVSLLRLAYRDNEKILNTKQTDYKLAKQASQLALCCDVKCKDLELLTVKEMAEIAFEEEDYTTATKLLSMYSNCCE